MFTSRLVLASGQGHVLTLAGRLQEARQMLAELSQG